MNFYRMGRCFHHCNRFSCKIGLTQILPTSRAVTRVLPLCYHSVTAFDAGHRLTVLKIGLTQILPTSRAVTRVLPLCYHSVTAFDTGHRLTVLTSELRMINAYKYVNMVLASECV